MHRVWGQTIVVAVLVLLGGVSSWGQVIREDPVPNNDISDFLGNTAGGTRALGGAGAFASYTTGAYNTAFGLAALERNSTGANNTAVGVGALNLNATGANNTAVGYAALERNSTGANNTAIGFGALNLNATGIGNTAIGFGALNLNTGDFNTAVGPNALERNTTGDFNTAIGRNALVLNTTGIGNSAVGDRALESNTTGVSNTAVGPNALVLNTTGAANTAVGDGAGSTLEDGSRNIYLGHPGAAVESDTMRLGQAQTQTFIAGIADTPVTGSPVFISAAGQLGILASSVRYKRDIHDLGERSRGVLQLRPVSFRYTQDPQGGLQYGLIAEEVAAVYPELVVRGADGTVEAVQYHALIPLVLNEMQHQQQALAGQARQLAELKAQNERLQARDEEQRAQHAALTARLLRLEEGATRATTPASR